MHARRWSVNRGTQGFGQIWSYDTFEYHFRTLDANAPIHTFASLKDAKAFAFSAS
jgi:hypothetical protein